MSPGSTKGGARFPLVAIYADESCLGNGREGSNPGGAAGLVEGDDNRLRIERNLRDLTALGALAS